MSENRPIPNVPAQPSTVFSPPPVVQKPRLTSDRRDITLAVALIVLAVGAANLTVYGGFHLGYAISALVLLLCGSCYLHGRLNRPSPYGVLCLALALAGAGLFVWHNDSVIRLFAFCGMPVLTILALLDATGLGQHDSGTVASLADVSKMLLIRPFERLSQTIPAIFLVKQGDNIEKRQCGGVFLGLLCALPVLLVVIPLLISADAAFEGLLQHTLLDNLGELFGSVVLGVGLFCLLFSLLYGVRHRLPEEHAAPRSRAGIAPSALNAFLGSISIVYGVYLLSQLAYFFSAFSGILPEEYTVAQYARRGFFEMAAICTINLVLVAVSLWLSHKQEGKAPLSTRLIGLFILVFSIGLVATALSKMVLYIGSFGMTRLRILTSVFMVMLTVVLVSVIVRLFAARFPYMKVCVIAIALLGLVVGYVDMDTAIARHNISAYESGKLETLDLDTLSNLSEGATPYLVELWDDRTEENEQQLATILYSRLEAFGDVDYKDGRYTFNPTAIMDFRHYNVDLFRARELLVDRAQDICDVHFGDGEKSDTYLDREW